jgi:hypothetical protein
MSHAKARRNLLTKAKKRSREVRRGCVRGVPSMVMDENAALGSTLVCT